MKHYLKFFIMACVTSLIGILWNNVGQSTYELSIAKMECLTNAIRINMDAREMYKEGSIDLETMNLHYDILKQ